MPTYSNGLWKNKVFQVKSDHPDWGAPRIHKELESDAKKTHKKGVPGERTVGRMLSNWEKLSDEEKALHRTFHWPGTMQQRALPWVTSQAGLELLAYTRVLGAGRPSNQLVACFWHVSQGIPNASVRHRLALSVDILTHQLLGKAIPEGLEWWSAFTAARAKGSIAAGSYEAAVLDPQNPIPDYTPVLHFPPSTQGESDPATLEELDFAWSVLWGTLGIGHTADVDNEPKELDNYLETFNLGLEGEHPAKDSSIGQ
jgi:hypothetical protein